VAAHERELLAYALERLPAELPGIRIFGPPVDRRSGVVAFDLPEAHPHDIAQILDREGIAIRAGHHCTMPLHERLDISASARASVNVYTTRDEIDALVGGLREVRRIFG
jgi:cysteine desulfurase/selenocysteine lyase